MSSNVRLLSKEIMAFQRDVILRSLQCARIMRSELTNVEASEKEKDAKVQSLEKRAQELSSRKSDLQEKLKDLESLKYVVDELERKEKALIKQRADEEQSLTDRIEGFRKNIQLFKLGVITAFDSMGAKMKSVLHPKEFVLDDTLELQHKMRSKGE